MKKKQKLSNGYLHIYTGNGKGKTTAALGLAVRAVGAGHKVFIGQFLKKGVYHEVRALKKFGRQVTIEQYGRGCFIRRKPQRRDKQCAARGLERIRTILRKKKHSLVIIDELTLALYYRLVSTDEVIDLLKNRPANIEVVVTGRKMPAALGAIADLITEMKEVRHYFRRGVTARRGIEF